MENQRDKEKNDKKGYTPENDRRDNRPGEIQEPTQNLKWDQAQRRQQAGPRSYNESTESQNISNQNTEAHKEQLDTDESNDPNDPKLIGDQISERQQTIDEDDAPRDKGDKRNKD